MMRDLRDGDGGAMEDFDGNGANRGRPRRRMDGGGVPSDVWSSAGALGGSALCRQEFLVQTKNTTVFSKTQKNYIQELVNIRSL